MVSSRINSAVVFKQHKTIDIEDKGHQSSLYELNIGGEKNVVIALGKPKYTFSPQNVVYYPIYMVSLTNAIEGCIGVFETKLNDPKMGVINLDEDGDIDINKMGSPILFEFADKLIENTKTTVEGYLEHAAGMFASNINNQETTASSPHAIDEITQGQPSPTPPEDEDEDKDDVFKLPSSSKKSISPEKKSNIFTFQPNTTPLPPLPEETEKEAEEIKTKFVANSQNNWIQKFLKNPNYQIHSIPGDGDCFFTTVVRAFTQIGRITTVEILRKLVAEEADTEIFEQYRVVYSTLKNEIRNFNKEMKEIKQTIEVDLKQRSQRITEAKDKSVLKDEVGALKKRYQDISAQRKEVQGLINTTTGDLENITTLDKFKDYIQTSTFWANEWAISIIEKKLNVKMIILSEMYYNENDMNNVLTCGEVNKETQTKGVFNPEYYIITTYSGNHYELVSYFDKKILKYNEIPYDIRILVIKRCLERNSGIYYLIQEFRDFKMKLGIDPDEGNPQGNEEEETHEIISKGYDNLYDPKIVFSFYSKSNKKPYPGKGSHEEVPEEKYGDFSTLATIPDWRKKLDDSWMEAKFTLDGKDYASVEHYYQASKFKNSHPGFADLFTLGSGSPISKDVDLCQGAGGKSGKYKKEQIRSKDYKIDPDFYPERNKEERKRAVEAKFTQNVDLQFLLLNTKEAKLVKYVPGSTRKPDIDLMKLREKMAKK